LVFFGLFDIFLHVDEWLPCFDWRSDGAIAQLRTGLCLFDKEIDLRKCRL